jgi:hypothetical protein
VTLFNFLSLKYDVNVPSKGYKQQNIKKKFFGGILKVIDENSRNRIQDPDPDPNPDPSLQSDAKRQRPSIASF